MKSRKSKNSRRRRSRKSRTEASTTMSLTELQFMAKNKGLPFGGLTKSQLVRKINAY